MKFVEMLKKNKGGARLFWVAALLAAWELGVKALKPSPMLFPSVEQVAVTLWRGLVQGDLAWQAAYSVWIILEGLVIGGALAFLLALASVRWPVAASFVDTVTAIAHPLPGLALLPLLIMWFGVGSGAVLAIIVHSVLWPLLLNLTAGFRATPAIYLELARNYGLSSAAITWEIRVKSALSYIISGLKIGWARAWRSLISAEMVFGAVGAKGGVGWYILTQRTFMNTAGLFAGIVVVVAIGVLVEDVLFAQLEKRTIKKWGMAQP